MYKVIKTFNDKYTGERYKIGDILTISKERANEILSVDKLIEEVEIEPVENMVEETPKKNRRRSK